MLLSEFITWLQELMNEQGNFRVSVHITYENSYAKYDYPDAVVRLVVNRYEDEG